MPRLMLPGAEMRASFVEAMGEFRVEGRGGEHDRSTLGNEIRDGRWRTPAGFAEFVADLRAKAVDEPAPGRVRSTTWWWCWSSPATASAGTGPRPE